MHRRAVLFSLLAGFGLVGASAVPATLGEDEKRAGLITVFDANGDKPSASPSPLTSRQREQRRQRETPEQLQRRNDYAEHLKQQRLSADRPPGPRATD